MMDSLGDGSFLNRLALAKCHTIPKFSNMNGEDLDFQWKQRSAEFIIFLVQKQVPVGPLFAWY